MPWSIHAKGICGETELSTTPVGVNWRIRTGFPRKIAIIAQLLNSPHLEKKEQLMWLSTVWHYALYRIQSIAKKAETRIKAWTKPATNSLMGDTAVDLVKNTMAENALLRQQLIVLKRQVKQPKFSPRDRGLLVLLASRVQDWKNALVIVSRRRC
jgi:hypothetical protein